MLDHSYSPARSLPWHHPLTLICTWFCSGKMKPAPGTWGSFFTLPIPILLGASFGAVPLTFILLCLITLGLLAIGSIATHYYMKATRTHDASEIVIDEVVGMLAVMIMTFKPLAVCYMESPYYGALMLLAVFAAFRVFDILKPFPIRWCDQRIHGAFGVMFDDIVAAVFASITLHILFIFLAYALIHNHPVTP
ncbi:MAG: phosphatidylglycerophosphatase A [Alphaproteobacteria bacterium]|nr:phosphatidylglycerophosphatase A [Alphaproteobacteria bacterium]